MRFDNQPHRFYAGGDLHARTLYLHVVDEHGKTCFEKNLAALDPFLVRLAATRRLCGAERS